MNKTRIYRWYKCPRHGREDIEDDKRPHASKKNKNMGKVKETVNTIVESLIT